MTGELASVPSYETLGDTDFEFLRRTVYELSRINLGTDKRALVAARVGKRLRALKLASFRDYCQLIRTSAGAEELSNLIDVISTNHTLFFREGSHFEYLTNELLPRWRERTARTSATLRVWSAACSSGEEPHTLAIVLADFFQSTSTWSIEATDISTRILARAQQAIYEADKVAPIRPDLLRRYFQRGVGQWEGHFRVKEELRTRITFRHLNLLQEHYPFTERFHVIFCRNVMIYFDRPTQETLVAKLADQLEPGGHLIVGHSESLGNLHHPLRQLQPTIYQKSGGGK